MKQILEMEHQAKLETMRNDEKIAMEARKVEVKSLTSQLECLRKKYKEEKKANEQAEARLKQIETDHSDEIKSKIEQIENLKLALSAIKEMYDQYKVKMKNVQTGSLKKVPRLYGPLKCSDVSLEGTPYSAKLYIFVEKRVLIEIEENAELYNSNIARLKEEIECFKINYY